MLRSLTPPFTLRGYALSSFVSRFYTSVKEWSNIHFQSPTLQCLLSLLLEDRGRHPAMQVHCQLITTGFHCDPIDDDTGITIWNRLLREYSQGSFPEEAFKIYKQYLQGTQMPVDSFTMSFLLKACANLMEPTGGTQLHGCIIKMGLEFHLYVQTALLNMYLMCSLLCEAKTVFSKMPRRNQVTWNVMLTGLTKWGAIDHALVIFDRMPLRNVVSWTGLIDGYTRANRPREALALFNQMMAMSTKPTEVTIVTILPAVSNLGNLKIGQSIHAYTEKSCYNESDIRVTNALIDMYGKCGSIESAFRFFKEISARRNLVSWNTIISSLAMHGMAREAVEHFENMKKANLMPNRVTFLSLLNACSHGGLVEEGLEFFQMMIKDYGIVPEIKHYGCMVDMMGRSGRMEEAEKMILELDQRDDIVLWRTLLGACSFHGNSEMGKRVLEKILEKEIVYGGDYVLLSNILAVSGRFGDVERVRRCMDEMNAIKVPGRSLIDGKIRFSISY